MAETIDTIPARPVLLRIAEFLLLLTVFSLGFMQPYTRWFGPMVQPTDAVFPLLVVVFCLLLLLGAVRFKYDRFYLIFIFYFAALALSAIFSASPQQSFIKLAGEAYLIGLAVIFHQLVESRSTLRRLFLTWIAASTVVCIIGVITVVLFYVDRSSIWHEFFLHHYGSLPPGDYPRVQSTFVYPALLCNYLTVSFFILLASVRLGWIGRGTFFFIAALHTITAVFTITPGLGGLLLGGCIWFALEAKAKGNRTAPKLLIAGGVFAAAAFLAVSLFTLRHIETSPYHFELYGNRIDPTQRLLTWQGAAGTFLENPVFGRGLGLGVAKVEFLAPSGQRQMLTDAHNLWLNVAGQAGMFGLAGILFITFGLFRRSLPLGFLDDRDAILRTALGIAFVSAFIFQGVVGSFENARHLWILIGLILAVSHSKIGALRD